MKRFLTTAFLAVMVATSFSQDYPITSLSHNDLGILLSRDDNYGTSRFNAMSGAFGALGGDLSSISINPAGGAVAINSKAGITLGVNSTSSDVNYYKTTNNFQDEHFNLAQAGGVFVYDNHNENSKWNRFALSLNYQLKADFSDSFIANGKGEYLYFTSNPDEDNDNPYDIGVQQYFERKTTGQASKFSIGFSSMYNSKLYVGATLNFHDINFRELAKLEEQNEDKNFNKLNALNAQETFYQGNGVSLGVGLIYKLDNFRLGLAYETPTWYQEVIEESNIQHQKSKSNNKSNPNLVGYTNIITSEPDGTSNQIEFDSENVFYKDPYMFRTPSKVTASGAYIFGKQGLISIDYTFKNYTTIRFNADRFSEVNKSFSQDYRDTHTLNVGAEWRFDKLSVRGGYHYEKNPNLLLGGSVNIDNARGYSLGLGYNFGNIIIDLGYHNTERTDFYHLYQLNDMNVDNTISRITGTLTINL